MTRDDTELYFKRWLTATRPDALFEILYLVDDTERRQKNYRRGCLAAAELLQIGLEIYLRLLREHQLEAEARRRRILPGLEEVTALAIDNLVHRSRIESVQPEVYQQRGLHLLDWLFGQLSEWLEWLPEEDVPEHYALLNNLDSFLGEIDAPLELDQKNVNLPWMFGPTYHLIPVEVRVNILRDAIGPPTFTPTSVKPATLAWNDGAVTRLAQTVDPAEPATYQILADALEEAGHRGLLLINHLREPGSHTRHCWAIDHILQGE